jgi:hypothetical protein
LRWWVNTFNLWQNSFILNQRILMFINLISFSKDENRIECVFDCKSRFSFQVKFPANVGKRGVTSRIALTIKKFLRLLTASSNERPIIFQNWTFFFFFFMLKWFLVSFSLLLMVFGEKPFWKVKVFKWH